MKSGGQSIAILVVVLCCLSMGIKGQPFSLYSAQTNSFQENGSGTNAPLPVIEMKDVPLGQAVTQLAKRAKIKLGIDSRLIEWWNAPDAQGRHIHEPLLNFRWTNTTADEAFFRVLLEHNLVLDEDPLTLVPRVTFKYDPAGPVKNPDESVVPADYVSFDHNSNTIPLIEFQDVPITVALENLARQGGIRYLLDPWINYGQPDGHGGITVEPTLTIRWNGITAAEGFNAVCARFGFSVVRDPAANVVLLRKRNHNVEFVKSDFYRNDTNVVSVECRGMPVSTILKDLAREAHIKCIFSARVDPNDPAREPHISLLWKNIPARQAFAAICENYDLDVNVYPDTDVIEVEPAY